MERTVIFVMFAMESLTAALCSMGNASPTMTVPTPEEHISTEAYYARHPEIDDLFPDHYFDVIDDLYYPQAYPKRCIRPVITDYRNVPLALKELLTPNAPKEIATQNQTAIDYRAGEQWFTCRLPKLKKGNAFFDQAYFDEAFLKRQL